MPPPEDAMYVLGPADMIWCGTVTVQPETSIAFAAAAKKSSVLIVCFILSTFSLGMLWCMRENQEWIDRASVIKAATASSA